MYNLNAHGFRLEVLKTAVDDNYSKLVILSCTFLNSISSNFLKTKNQ
jgi:hypothetical protein